jgi:hypothetical protein
MIDKNYLGHILEDANNLSYKDYICKKCNALIWVSNGVYRVLIGTAKDGHFDKLELNCEEYIIKNIIE